MGNTGRKLSNEEVANQVRDELNAQLEDKINNEPPLKDVSEGFRLIREEIKKNKSALNAARTALTGMIDISDGQLASLDPKILSDAHRHFKDKKMMLDDQMDLYVNGIIEIIEDDLKNDPEFLKIIINGDISTEAQYVSRKILSRISGQ